MNKIHAPVVIQISKEEILSCNISRVVGILDSFVPQLSELNRNRVDLQVLGYNSKPRELYDIPEVRAYFAKLCNEYDGLFYWANLDSYTFILLGLLLFEPLRISGHVTIARDDLQKYLYTGFMKLNQYCAANSLSPEPTSKTINAWVKANL